MYIGLQQSACFCCQILINHEFSRQIFEIYSKTSNFMKIRPVGTAGVAFGRTDRTKAKVAFRNFAKAPIALKGNVLLYPMLTDFRKEAVF